MSIIEERAAGFGGDAVHVKAATWPRMGPGTAFIDVTEAIGTDSSAWISAADAGRLGRALVAIEESAQDPAGDPVGSVVYVVGNAPADGGRTLHFFDIGTEVEVIGDIDEDGDYHVRSTDQTQFVSAIDLDVNPPQPDPTGAVVYVAIAGTAAESGHHFDVGDEVEVLKDCTDDGGTYYVSRLSDGHLQWLFPQELDVNPPPPPVEQFVTGAVLRRKDGDFKDRAVFVVQTDGMAVSFDGGPFRRTQAWGLAKATSKHFERVI